MGTGAQGTPQIERKSDDRLMKRQAVTSGRSFEVS